MCTTAFLCVRPFCAVVQSAKARRLINSRWHMKLWLRFSTHTHTYIHTHSHTHTTYTIHNWYYALSIRHRFLVYSRRIIKQFYWAFKTSIAIHQLSSPSKSQQSARRWSIVPHTFSSFPAIKNFLNGNIGSFYNTHGRGYKEDTKKKNKSQPFARQLEKLKKNIS